MNLKDKIVVITGGSKGLGKAMAKYFAAEGSKVTISARDEAELRVSAKELSADYFVADVTKSENIEALAEYAAGKYGSIDIWVNNAGIQIAPSLLEDIDNVRFHQLFEINFFGYVYGCQTALKHMKKQKQGTIINIASTAGLEGKPLISAYSSSKFAVRGLTESIRKEVEGSGINIFGVFPGGIQTEIYQEKYPEDFNEYMLVDSVSERVVNNLKNDSPEIDLIIKRPKA